MTCTTTTTTSSVTPVTGAGTETVSCIYECLSNPADTLFTLGSPATAIDSLDVSSLENRCQFPIGGLLTEAIQLFFKQCLCNGDFRGFTALGCTNTHSFITMRKLMNEPLTQLCPNLRILDAKTFTFHADLENIDKYQALQSYCKLEPFVEDREGLTMIFNHGGLTFKDMKDNKCGVAVHVGWDLISEELDNVPEEATGPEMISNAPVTETRDKKPEVQETRVRDEVGFDGKPTLIGSLALMIASQKELKICLFGKRPRTYGRTSTQVDGIPVDVGSSALGHLHVSRTTTVTMRLTGAGGRQVLGPLVREIS